MAFRDFTFPRVEQDLGLHLRDADLFSSAPECPVRESIAEIVREGVQLALANSTEKAKSEFIIAPVLLELRRLAGGQDRPVFRRRVGHGAVAGIERLLRLHRHRRDGHSVPVRRGRQHKNDLIRTGLGQCIARLMPPSEARPTHANVGAGLRRRQHRHRMEVLEVDGDEVLLDRDEQFIDNLPKIMRDRGRRSRSDLTQSRAKDCGAS